MRWVRACLCLAAVLFPAHFAYSEAILSFEGQANLAAKTVELTLVSQGEKSVSAKFAPMEKDVFLLTATIDHLSISGLDISTEIESVININRNPEAGNVLYGSLKSRYTLIDYKPARELVGSFEIKKNRFFLNSLSWEGVRVSGYFDFLSPFSLDFSFLLDEVSMKDLSSFLGCREDDLNLNGFVSGRITLSGFLDKVMVRGSLLSYEGFVGDLEYNKFDIQFEGVYPTVEITQASVSQADGLSFSLNGYFDLSSGCDIEKGIDALKMSPLIDESEVVREWTIKRRQEEGRAGTTEFKYRLKIPQETQTDYEREDGILGVEHSIEF